MIVDRESTHIFHVGRIFGVEVFGHRPTRRQLFHGVHDEYSLEDTELYQKCSGVVTPVCCLVSCQAREIKLFERGAKYDDGGAAVDWHFILSLRITV